MKSKLCYKLLLLDGTIVIKISKLTPKRVGIGFEPDENTMKNADIVLCKVVNNITYVTDSFALDVGVSFICFINFYGLILEKPPKADIEVGGKDDILWFRGSEVDGLTTIEFRRKLDTGDSR